MPLQPQAGESTGRGITRQCVTRNYNHWNSQKRRPDSNHSEICDEVIESSAVLVRPIQAPGCCTDSNMTVVCLRHRAEISVSTNHHTRVVGIGRSQMENIWRDYAKKSAPIAMHSKTWPNIKKMHKKELESDCLTQLPKSSCQKVPCVSRLKKET